MKKNNKVLLHMSVLKGNYRKFYKSQSCNHVKYITKLFRQAMQKL